MDKPKAVDIRELFAEFPPMFRYLTTHFKKEDVVLQHTLLHAVDKSEFSLHEWVESLMVMDQWLTKNRLNLSTRNSIEYVSCAAASVGGNPTLCHLPSMVHDFLKQYGCERAVNDKPS